MTHTPGPWVFKDSPMLGLSKLWNPETGQDVLIPERCVYDLDDDAWMGEDMTPQDRALIEAAPDLLRALVSLKEEAIAMAEQLQLLHLPNCPDRSVDEAIMEAAAVISKIKGAVS